MILEYEFAYQQENAFENGGCEMAAILCRPQCVEITIASPNNYNTDAIRCAYLFDLDSKLP